jgi:hypothetical protein
LGLRFSPNLGNPAARRCHPDRGVPVQLKTPMKDAIAHLNYVSVLVVAVVGFLLGWLWYSPILFAKAWLAEMKITPEQIAAEKEKGMAGYLVKGFLFTLLSTFGLAVIIRSHGVPNWKHGAAVAAFIGVFVVLMRYLSNAVWEKKSCKLQAIVGLHEVVLYTVQGAILGLWQ